jgi:hypothetical protein
MYTAVQTKISNATGVQRFAVILDVSDRQLIAMTLN